MLRSTVLLALLFSPLFSVFGQSPAPDCQFTRSFTTATAGAAFSNKPTATSGTPCTYWVVEYWTNGASGVSVKLEGSADAAGVSAGSYAALTAASGSSNPMTGTTQGTAVLCCDYYPWLRVNPTTFSGATKSMIFRGYGWRAPTNPTSGGGGGGDVVGPASATDNAVARFDGTTGKLIQNSVLIVDDSGNAQTPGNMTVNNTVIPANLAGTDILNGAGNFAINGLTGWTSPTGNLSDWSIVGGNLVHTPGTDPSRIAYPVTVRQANAYVMQSQIVSQSAGSGNLNLGADCNSDCSDNFTVGANVYWAIASFDDGASVVEISVTADSNVTLSSVAVLGPRSIIESTSYGNSNSAIGAGAFASNTTGYANNALGMGALFANTSGSSNNAVGTSALRSNTTGYSNNAVGNGALRSNTSGGLNNAFGEGALRSNTSGQNNNATGYSALLANVTGSGNSAFGDNTLSSALGSGNVAIGANAGSHETGANTFYVDSQHRADLAADKAGALLYGTFDATPSNQQLTINAGNVSTPGTISAGVGGSTAGMVALVAGTANTPPANSVGWQAPTSVPREFLFTMPSAPADGFLHVTNATPSIVTIVPAPAMIASCTAATLATLIPLASQQCYCTDCQVTSAIDNTCTGTGSGAMAFRIGSDAKCLQ